MYHFMQTYSYGLYLKVPQVLRYSEVELLEDDQMMGVLYLLVN